MKRRDFLKLIGIAPIAPSVLAAKKKIPFKLNYAQTIITKARQEGQTFNTFYTSNPTGYDHFYEMCVGSQEIDIPEGMYKWIQVIINYDATTQTVTVC